MREFPRDCKHEWTNNQAVSFTFTKYDVGRRQNHMNSELPKLVLTLTLSIFSLRKDFSFTRRSCPLLSTNDEDIGAVSSWLRNSP